MAKPLTVAGVVRAVAALAYLAAALAVFGHISTESHWTGFTVRAPIVLLIPWAYSLKHRSVVTLACISFIAVVSAFFIVAVPAWRLEFPPYALKALALVGLSTLIGALTVHAGLVLRAWRDQRKRLRDGSHGPLERLSSGY